MHARVCVYVCVFVCVCECVCVPGRLKGVSSVPVGTQKSQPLWSKVTYESYVKTHSSFVGGGWRQPF